MKPLVIDLFCGLGGWTKGFLAEGYRAVGFDIERHDYGSGGYPGDLVLQDILTVHGSQFRDAACIVASPPCQRYSWMAMPWSESKREIRWQLWQRTSQCSPGFTLNDLFNACFQIRDEASRAAGRYIPMVVENVKGAQPWVGRAKAHYGSYYLWGDVEDVGGRIVASGPLRFGQASVKARVAKNGGGGSWWPISHGVDSGETYGVNPVRGESVGEGVKQHGSGAAWFDTALDERRREATKCGGAWFESGNDMSMMRQHNSKSSARKAASAAIAEIPFELAAHIARCFKP